MRNGGEETWGRAVRSRGGAVQMRNADLGVRNGVEEIWDWVVQTRNGELGLRSWVDESRGWVVLRGAIRKVEIRN